MENTSRHEATLTSSTGGYAVVALLDGEGDEEWRRLLDALAERGYVQAADDDERSAATELLDVVRGRRPVIHESLERAPEYDTATMAAFRTRWRPIGGGRVITLLSLTARELLASFGDLAHSARKPRR